MVFIFGLILLLNSLGCGPIAKQDKTESNEPIIAVPKARKIAGEDANAPVKPATVVSTPAINSDFYAKLNAIILTKDHSFSSHEELDLHGKKLKSIEAKIKEFFEASQKAGLNYVLVITGKGKHSKKTELLPDGTEVGRIKYQFMAWLESNYFNNYIDAFSYALAKDGGEGAFYIRLKPK